MDRIRLLLLITDLKVGGVPLHVLRLATSLPRDRFRVRVVSLADIGPVGERLLAAGIPVDACDAVSARDARALLRLAGYVRRYRPHVLHAVLFHANIAARLVGPIAGVAPGRIVCEIQTVERERRWHLPVDGLTCRLCRFVVGNSQSVVEHLHRAAHIPRSRLWLIRGGVDVERVAAAAPADRAALGVPPGAPLVLWVGRIDRVKGLDELVDAMTTIWHRTGAHLVLAGEGEYADVLRVRIARSRADAYVHAIGRRDDVPALLAAADVFAFPSYTEGLPNALMEAMAAGRAIVTTDVPGCHDLITHGQTGLLAPPHDAPALARAIERLLSDAALRGRLGAAASAWVRRHCNWVTTARHWAHRYEAIASSSRKPCRLTSFDGP